VNQIKSSNTSVIVQGENVVAAEAFLKSVKLGNATDWQALVELCVDFPAIKLAA
jgi:hypothetical protein